MENVETSSQRQSDLLSASVPSINPRQLDYAANRARLLFGCYRKADANDPETYTAAITAILAEYEADVIQRVTDPRMGIPRRLKFMPNPAEVADACDEAKRTIIAERKLAELGWSWDGAHWQGPNATPARYTQHRLK